ncbi:PPR domain-containing protein/PPR_1 domain-containing protein [Cephalotus follicularis]|uniref:PPR domain-containing protein/PPR_1 domain-containing protein n=1 Tax=Cephalotus follicularis TaxID=3775 RepID=A0A1Q3C446_CEPFO|nr:PPR domain-containing protein/PPR_1 domain-containing protein [Cephalotus follicularis]
MKLSNQKQLQILSANTHTIQSSNAQPKSLPSSSSSSEAPTCLKPKLTTTSNLKLTQQELTKINLLIPRLCLFNHLTTAINLITTALLTNPPPKSLSLSILTHSLASQPDLTLPMSLLTRLKHIPQAHPHLTHITTMLITSFLRQGRPKDALKVYHWMIRPGSSCEVEPVVYGILVHGFCGKGLVLEALRVLRDMVGIRLMPGVGLRKTVFRSLLREARVKEAVEFDEALKCVGKGCEGEVVKKVVDLLDHMIANWAV